MHKVIVTTSTGIRTLGSTYLYLTVALWHTMNGAGLSDTHHLHLRFRPRIAERVKHLHRIIGNHAVEHILDLVGCRPLMSYDK